MPIPFISANWASVKMTAFNQDLTDETGYFIAFKVEPTTAQVSMNNTNWYSDEDGEFVLEIAQGETWPSSVPYLYVRLDAESEAVEYKIDFPPTNN